MRHWRSRVGMGCVLLGALWVACVAGALQTGQNAVGGRIGEGFPLLLMPKVQKELKLSAEQIDRVQKEWQAVLKLAAPDPEATQAPTEEQQKEIEARQHEMEEKAATDLLSANQQQRIRQILLQARGPGLLLRKEVAAELELTSAQTSTIRTIIKQAETRRTEILSRPPADDSARRKQHDDLRTLRQETATKARAILTPEQQKRWHAMLGEPFELEP